MAGQWSNRAGHWGASSTFAGVGQWGRQRTDFCRTIRDVQAIRFHQAECRSELRESLTRRKAGTLHLASGSRDLSAEEQKSREDGA